MPHGLKAFIGRELEENFDELYGKIEDDIEIEAGKNKVTIRLMGESTFDSGKAEIKPELKPMILRIGNILSGQTAGDIIIAGHTDDIPVRGGPFQSNLKLSIARSATVAQFLIDRTTIDPRRVSTMGFGEYRPIADNLTESGRRKNRRVEIIVGNHTAAQWHSGFQSSNVMMRHGLQPFALRPTLQPTVSAPEWTKSGRRPNSAKLFLRDPLLPYLRKSRRVG